MKKLLAIAAVALNLLAAPACTDKQIQEARQVESKINGYSFNTLSYSDNGYKTYVAKNSITEVGKDEYMFMALDFMDKDTQKAVGQIDGKHVSYVSTTYHLKFKDSTMKQVAYTYMTSGGEFVGASRFEGCNI